MTVSDAKMGHEKGPTGGEGANSHDGLNKLDNPRICFKVLTPIFRLTSGKQHTRKWGRLY